MDGGEVPGHRQQPLRRWVVKLALVGVPLLILGEAGHLLLNWARDQLAHHFFHIVFGLGAGALFLVYVILDIRHNGWPGFTWRLRPDSPGSHRSDLTT